MQSSSGSVPTWTDQYSCCGVPMLRRKGRPLIRLDSKYECRLACRQTSKSVDLHVGRLGRMQTCMSGFCCKDQVQSLMFVWCLNLYFFGVVCNRVLLSCVFCFFYCEMAAQQKRHHVLQAVHPSPLSAHRGFFGCKHFSRTNELLKKSGKTPIDWTAL